MQIGILFIIILKQDNLQFTIKINTDYPDLSFDKKTRSTTKFTRKLSVTIQLTDEKEYKGGELLLSTTTGKNKNKILATNYLKRKVL